MTKTSNIKFEKALRFLSQHLPISDENTRKPVMFHDISVGIYLFERGYSEEIVLTGFLHDILECSKITEGVLREQFGDKVTELVLASTKNYTIQNPDNRVEDLIQRCVKAGNDALIVKIADTIDSFKYYAAIGDLEELNGHCVKNAEKIMKYKPETFVDPILIDLKLWYERYSKF